MKQQILPLFEIAPMEEIHRELSCQRMVPIYFSVGANDGKVYILYRYIRYQQCKIQKAYYAVVTLSVDWKQGTCGERQIDDLGDRLSMGYDFVYRQGDDWLLIGARCDYNNGNPERNGLLLGRDGTVKRTYCFGDGIDECIVMPDGTIVTSYFDEGTFADWGKGAPIGWTGIVAWRPDGTKLWDGQDYEGNYGGACDFCDDAICLDTWDGLWFYKAGQLVRADLCLGRDHAYALAEKIVGKFQEQDEANRLFFTVSLNHCKLLFNGKHIFTQKACTWRWTAEAEPHLNGKPVLCQCVRYTDYRMLFLTNDGILCGCRFV
ncbi:hypothetical protein [uncultured Rikenella sp.]|uniref:hypothetical protein n=1 Tax=uncultured Rikenella sp. TaxID=368003 RepID=UPI002620F3B8|nr:hypothetical protein [uncultured Rikenella sp.]